MLWWRSESQKKPSSLIEVSPQAWLRERLMGATGRTHSVSNVAPSLNGVLWRQRTRN